MPSVRSIDVSPRCVTCVTEPLRPTDDVDMTEEDAAPPRSDLAGVELPPPNSRIERCCESRSGIEKMRPPLMPPLTVKDAAASHTLLVASRFAWLLLRVALKRWLRDGMAELPRLLLSLRTEEPRRSDDWLAAPENSPIRDEAAAAAPEAAAKSASSRSAFDAEVEMMLFAAALRPEIEDSSAALPPLRTTRRTTIFFFPPAAEDAAIDAAKHCCVSSRSSSSFAGFAGDGEPASLDIA
jgi:hypothetical protein